jgi:hypothetical protein
MQFDPSQRIQYRWCLRHLWTMARWLRPCNHTMNILRLARLRHKPFTSLLLNTRKNSESLVEATSEHICILGDRLFFWHIFHTATLASISTSIHGKICLCLFLVLHTSAILSWMMFEGQVFILDTDCTCGGLRIFFLMLFFFACIERQPMDGVFSHFTHFSYLYNRTFILKCIHEVR